MQQFLRRSLLAVADHPVVADVIKGRRVTRGLVRRFVAGERLEEALVAARRIAAQGMTTTLDQLGENVNTAEAARRAVAGYLETLERMADVSLEPNISVKLTMLGLDLDAGLAKENMIAILTEAHRVGGFVRIDMEGSAYVERTITIAESLHERFPHEVGTVIQSYLHRSPADTERLIARGMRVRLVKGAYAEPASIALQQSEQIDVAYSQLMERLLDDGHYPALATHDPALIRAAKGYALRMGIPPERFEFQMLYGVRRDAQTALTAAGYRMRVYVPYGTEWYPYFTRRIAERPANAMFVLRQLASG